MTNAQGWIEKADPASLDGEMRELVRGWREKAYDDDNMLLTLARRPGMLRSALGFLRYAYGESTLDPELVEMVRVKLAWNNECRH